MTGPPSLRANTLWTFFGWGAFGGAQWAVLAALAKLGDKAMVGQYALGIAIATPVIHFSRLHLRAVLATDAKREGRYDRFLRLTLVTSVLAMLVVGGVVLAQGYPAETALVTIVLAASLVFESFSEIAYGMLQQRERMDWIGISMALRGVLSALAMAAVLWLANFVAAIIALACAYLVLFLVYDRRAVRRLLPDESVSLTDFSKEERAPLLALAAYSAPLGLMTLLLALNLNAPRYFVEAQLGVEELGVFAALASLLIPGKMIAVGLVQAATPRLSRHFAGGEIGAFRRLVGKLLALTVVAGVAALAVIALAGDFVITTLYTSEYLGQQALLLTLLAFTVITMASSIVGGAVIAMRRFRAPVVVHGIALLAVIVVSAALTRPLGLYGAAYAVLAASVVPLVVFSVIVFTAKSPETN